MENFIVSARKYRPSTFNSVVGQDSIVNTLKSSIRTNHVAQAFLFTGPRGVGKTTCARILAKALNCEHMTEDFEPCNECKSCKDFNSNASMNIYELDAASNSGVDDMRSLVDQVRIPPQGGKYKIYIIDEVHMLSTAAFNAFLKTLEEPPKHAIFILATTEKHKIIPTILSRCQIFDFRRITIEDIIHHLEFVAKSEKITIETEALHVIAQKADGGLRDALSIFDQVVSCSGSNVTYQDVISNLNVLDYEYYFRLTNSITEAQVDQSLVLLDEVYANGFDGQHFISGMSTHLRNLIIALNPATLPILKCTTAQGEKYMAQAKKCKYNYMLELLKIGNECDFNYKNSNNKRLSVELAILKMCRLYDASPLPSAPGTPSANTQKSDTPAPSAAPSAPVQQAVAQKPMHTEAVVPKPEFVKTQTGHTGMISIKSRQRNSTSSATQLSSTVTSNPNLPQNVEVTQEKVTENWAACVAEAVPDTLIILNVLKETTPVFDAKRNTVIIEVKNVVQEKEVQDVCWNIKSYLQQKLTNSSLEVEVKVDARTTNVEKKYITSEEQFKMWAEENQALYELKKRLNLDIL